MSKETPDEFDSNAKLASQEDLDYAAEHMHEIETNEPAPVEDLEEKLEEEDELEDVVEEVEQVSEEINEVFESKGNFEDVPANDFYELFTQIDERGTVLTSAGQEQTPSDIKKIIQTVRNKQVPLGFLSQISNQNGMMREKAKELIEAEFAEEGNADEPDVEPGNAAKRLFRRLMFWNN